MVRCEAHCELTYDGVLIFEHRGATGEGRARERSASGVTGPPPLVLPCGLKPFAGSIGLALNVSRSPAVSDSQEGRTSKSRVILNLN
jgi:hypothetical protein